MISTDKPNPKARRRVRMRMIQVLPSLLTLGNLLCGFAAIFYATRAPSPDHLFPNTSLLTIAAGFIFVGMIFDALDGRVARKLGQTSDLGGQLDSMADMVCCGVAPAVLIIQLINVGTPFFATPATDTFFDRAVLMVAAVYVACCALRLARFNIEMDEPEESDHMSFKGLPSPAAAGTLASLVMLHQSIMPDQASLAKGADTLAIGMIVITLLVAIAMVSTIRYTHVTNRYVRGRASFPMIAGGVIVLILLATFFHITLTVGFVIFVLSGPVVAMLKRRGPEAPSEPQQPADEPETVEGSDEMEPAQRQ